MTAERRIRLRSELDEAIEEAMLVRRLAQEAADRIDRILLAMSADRLADNGKGNASSD